MKIKKIIAANMPEAFAKVRDELGEDAVIISSENADDGQIIVTAALESDFDISFDDDETPEVFDDRYVFDETQLRSCLDYHGIVPVVAERIMSEARIVSRRNKLNDPEKILAEVFAGMFRYKDILDLTCPVKMFMGTPGTGKTTAIAKVATQAKFKKIPTCIISTDNVRAGANKQLQAFAEILELNFFFCKDERSLYDVVCNAKRNFKLILTDTPGINPFVEKEVDRIGRLSEVVKSDVILTIDAGRNAYEAVEIAEIFSKIGADRILPTRLDLTRRIGSVLSVAACCNFGFCSASVSSSIANGLAPIDNYSLAKLILAEA